MNEEIIRILEHSVEKNGEKPLTNKWLLNILKKANEESSVYRCDATVDDIY